MKIRVFIKYTDIMKDIIKDMHDRVVANKAYVCLISDFFFGDNWITSMIHIESILVCYGDEYAY